MTIQEPTPEQAAALARFEGTRKANADITTAELFFEEHEGKEIDHELGHKFFGSLAAELEKNSPEEIQAYMEVAMKWKREVIKRLAVGGWDAIKNYVCWFTTPGDEFFESFDKGLRSAGGSEEEIELAKRVMKMKIDASRLELLDGIEIAGYGVFRADGGAPQSPPPSVKPAPVPGGFAAEVTGIKPPPGAVYMGEDEDGRPMFAVSAELAKQFLDPEQYRAGVDAFRAANLAAGKCLGCGGGITADGDCADDPKPEDAA